MENMKNPIIKKTTLPFKELQSLAVPYAGNCRADAERVDMVCDCDCNCVCDCDCQCIEDNECHCDCSNGICDCNCVCDCGALDDGGTLIIPEGIERIYPETYRGQEKIKRVILPRSLKVIGEGAFRDCKALVEVVFGDALVEIERDAFRGCGALKTAELPDSVAVIGACAFQSCYALETVSFGRSFDGFDPNVFDMCNALSHIEVRSGNTHYKVIDGVLYSRCGRTLRYYPRGKCDENFVVPERVTKIMSSAFAGNDYLKTVTMQEGVKTICDRAFQYCNNLAQVALPRTLTTVEEGIFYDCRSLAQVTYAGTSREWAQVKIAGTMFSYQYDTYVRTSDD